MKRPNIEEYKDKDGKIILGLYEEVIRLQERYINYLERKMPVIRNKPNDIDKAIAKSLGNINGNMNFSGFNKRFVNNIEAEAEKGLSDKQREMMVLIMCKYRRQIPNFTSLAYSLPTKLKYIVADYLRGKK